MKIKPKLAYCHANYPMSTALDPNKIYDAAPATNQPDWDKQAKIFVECPNGAPEILLKSGEYTVIVEERGYYNQYGDKRFALLHENDELHTVKFVGDKIICDAICHNSEKECRVEIIIT